MHRFKPTRLMWMVIGLVIIALAGGVLLLNKQMRQQL